MRSTDTAVRLTVRGRVLLMSGLVLLLFVAFSGFLTAQAGTTATRPATRTVTVQVGETLWQIAEQVAPRDDPRDTVDRIRELNSLGTGVVQAGQRLVVPA